MNTMTMSEMAPSLKEEIEKLIDERVPKENTAVLQRIEALAMELRHQRELIQQVIEMTEKRFEAIDKRIEDMKYYTDKHFEAVNKRIEDLKHSSDKHFEAVNKRIEDLKHSSDKHFEAVNKRFEDMNKRFEDMNKRFNTLQWMIGIGFTAITILMAFFRFYAASSG